MIGNLMKALPGAGRADPRTPEGLRAVLRWAVAGMEPAAKLGLAQTMTELGQDLEQEARRELGSPRR